MTTSESIVGPPGVPRPRHPSPGELTAFYAYEGGWSTVRPGSEHRFVKVLAPAIEDVTFRGLVAAMRRDDQLMMCCAEHPDEPDTVCTRLPHETGRHAHGDGWIITAVWA